MKHIKNILCSNTGSAFIEMAFVYLVLIWLISLFVAFLPVFYKISQLNQYATYYARAVSLEGEITPNILNKMEQYKLENHLSGIVEDTSETEFFSGKKIQLNKEIVVKITGDYKFSFLGIPVNIPIKTKARIRSEVYHK